jgi:phage terminase Nu1 subunit (DNA packaging protein)
MPTLNPYTVRRASPCELTAYPWRQKTREQQRALKQVDHWYAQTSADLERIGASVAALAELADLAERLRLEVLER